MGLVAGELPTDLTLHLQTGKAFTEGKGGFIRGKGGFACPR